ncbi:MAG: hypothetical protein L0Y50_07960 [Beijerinckiaceae bacterium]|nr:hypothetical protein [Beijerinckiaceae bacterium]
MTGSLDWMPYRSGHSVSHSLVDGSRYKPIIHSLPHVNAPFDCCHVESPTPVEEFSVAHEPLATSSEAFGACVAEGGFEIQSKQNMPIVIVDGFPQLFGEGPTKVFGAYPKGRVHEAEARFKPQCEGSPQRVGDRYQVVSPIRVGACFLGTGLSYTGPVYAYES